MWHATEWESPWESQQSAPQIQGWGLSYIVYSIPVHLEPLYVTSLGNRVFVATQAKMRSSWVRADPEFNMAKNFFRKEYHHIENTSRQSDRLEQLYMLRSVKEREVWRSFSHCPQEEPSLPSPWSDLHHPEWWKNKCGLFYSTQFVAVLWQQSQQMTTVSVNLQ